MRNYKLIKIYDVEDKIKIKERLNVIPIEIQQNIVAIKYGAPSLPYFLINSFILRENMDHVVLYSDTFFKLINIIKDYEFKILKIKLLDIQEQIECLLDEILEKRDFQELNKLLEKYIPQKNIDIQFIKISNNNKETILYNNGVFSTEITDENLGVLKDILCSGL